MEINSLLTLFWLFLAAGVLLPGIWLFIDGKTSSKMIDFILQRFYLFGKLKNKRTKICTDLSKSYFRHFYLLGLMINIPLMIFSRSTSILFVIFICHMFRRLYECLVVHQFGRNSTMSLIHYLTGLAHYPLVGLTILIDRKYSSENPSLIMYPFALSLFLIASYVQYQVHLTLARTRRTEKENYPIPHGYWAFEYFSCPNYIAEILIYISLLLISHRTSSFISLVSWVIVNQCLSALLTQRWYYQHYGDNYPAKRCALIPFIL